MDLGLADATAVVQGGTKGMGRAAAECLAADGARVAVLARTRADLDEAASVLVELGSPDAVGLEVDIREADSVKSVFDAIGERWGSVNILINATGPGQLEGGFEALTDDAWMETLDVGALGMIRTVRAALPLLRKAEWARIVNLSAMSTQRQSAPLVAYTGAKALVTSVTKNLSISLAKDGILVNTVSPGSFGTPLMRDYASSMGVDPEDPHAILALVAENYGHRGNELGRVGEIEEIGAVVAFLASRRNSFMTGANVNVDGGTDFT